MTRTPMRPEARELAFDRSRSIPPAPALTQANSVAGESPSELFERMTVMMLQKLTDEIKALREENAKLKKDVSYLMGAVKV